MQIRCIITSKFKKKYFTKYISSLMWLGKAYEDFLSLGANFLKSYLNVRNAATSRFSTVELDESTFSTVELDESTFSDLQMNLPIVMLSAERK